jgi:hypothetical protein
MLCIMDSDFTKVSNDSTEGPYGFPAVGALMEVIGILAPSPPY